MPAIILQPIIIGAGRGSRLMPYTRDMPKCFAEVGGRRILDWALHAFGRNGLPAPVFIGGYCIDVVRDAYPGLVFRHNEKWAHNNVLASLFHAEDCMGAGFICSYADILYKPDVVRAALAHPADIVLGVDTHWRARYEDRSQHPEDDAEKVRLAGDRVTAIHRGIPPAEAHGEFIGVARFNRSGATALRQAYHGVRERVGDDGTFRDGRIFRKAYLIELLQHMIEQGVAVHCVQTAGDYLEIDTQEDYDLAREKWLRLSNLEI